MKKIVLVGLLTACLSTVYGQTKNWAGGVRFGEPFGLSVKKYIGESNAFDLTIGSWGSFYGGRRPYRDVYRSSGLAIMGNYLWQPSLDFLGVEGLDWYYGFGGQLGTSRYYKRFYDVNGRLVEDRQRGSVNLGVTGMVGTEWFIPSTQFSVFLDLALYLEVVPQPFWPNLQGGIGGRYNF